MYKQLQCTYVQTIILAAVDFLSFEDIDIGHIERLSSFKDFSDADESESMKEAVQLV